MNKKYLLKTLVLVLGVSLVGCVATREKPMEQPMPSMEKAEVVPPPIAEKSSAVQAMIQDLGGKVRFDFNSAELGTSAEMSLARIGELLSQNPNEKVRIDGFTDNVGSTSYNKELSESRVSAVTRILLEKGAAPYQIEAYGHGEEMPIAANDSAEGRAENRRVELSAETT